MNDLNLYVWEAKEGFWKEYTHGLAFAIASTVTAARQQLLDKIRKDYEHLWDIERDELADLASERQEAPPTPEEVDAAVAKRLGITNDPQVLPIDTCAFFVRGGS